MTRRFVPWVLWPAALLAACDRPAAPPSVPRASGFVEATEIRVATRVPGRVAEVHVTEGQRVARGDRLVTISTAEIDLALARARAERAQAAAQVRLLEAGARPEDITHARAQVQAAAADVVAARAELGAAELDEKRFTELVENRAGAVKARDDARARRELAAARVAAALDRQHVAEAALARVSAGARVEELAAARARVAAVDAQIATLDHDRADAVLTAPQAAVVSARLVEPGEMTSPASAAVVLIDLDAAWANAYVEEPLVPRLKLGGPATVVTDAGDRLPGRITFIASKAEFTPRNVQTSAERAKLVYRVKVAVDNSNGVLKPGMPVEVTFDEGQS